MTDPTDRPTTREVSGDAPDSAADPVVAWVSPADGKPAAGTSRRLAILVTVASLAVIVLLSVVRANAQPPMGDATWAGYVLGGVLIALLISLAARWIWLKVRRGEAGARLLSPWIAVGAVVVSALAAFGGKR